MSRLRTFVRHLHGDKGLSLIEMIVVIFILGIVLAMVQSTTITAQKDVASNASRLDQLQQSKVAMESMSKILRTSVLPTQLEGSCTTCDDAAFITGDVRSVQFYANINNDSNVIGPSQVSYTVAADGTLTEAIHGPNPHAATDFNYQYTCTAATAGCVVRSRVLARHVDTTQALFTYYDASGATIAPPLNAATLPLVDSIDVLIKVKVSKMVPAVSLTERVTLPNADAVANESASS
jgi:prepilin-type N-terminal cleavage/methylation domain-containing protein